MSFSTLESRVNAAALAKLANASAVISGRVVAGVFSNGYSEAFGGLVGGRQPTLLCSSADVSTVARNTAITVNGTGYTVADLRPDGVSGGMTLLILEES
ncbi:MAG: hypothetical protein H6R10_705 [Rhodocyclaceae bacterium]|nr:hypothetical protein [Rhodocyclaceae bacterium]